MLFIGRNHDIRRGWISLLVRIRDLFAALSVLLVASSSVFAQSVPTARKCAKMRSRDAIDKVATNLISNDEKAVFAAIDQLGSVCHPLAVEKLAALIREGQPDAVTDYVLETLGKSGSATAIDVLKEFTSHRRANARRLAYRALAAIHTLKTTELLSQGLRDVHPDVRATTALLLGEIGSSQQLRMLFSAFSRGVSEAAVAIGQLGGATSVDRFNQFLEKKPLTVMLSGYEQFLLREDISQEVKLNIVAALGEVSGPLVREFLLRILSREKRETPSALVRSIRATIRRIPTNQKAADKRPTEKSKE